MNSFQDKTCVSCDRIFKPSAPAMKRCDQCAGRGRPAILMATRQCRACACQFAPMLANQQYCCQPCLIKARLVRKLQSAKQRRAAKARHAMCCICGASFRARATKSKCDSCIARIKSGDTRVIKRSCVHCARPFMAASASTRYCSPQCQASVERPRAIAVCVQCGEAYSYRRGKADQGGRVGKYCSRACFFARKAQRTSPHGQLIQGAVEIKRCVECGAEAHGRWWKYCSDECRRLAANRKAKLYWARKALNSRRPVVCVDCGTLMDRGQCGARPKRCKACQRKKRRADKNRWGHSACARAKYFGAPRDYSIRAVDVLARDGWRCRLCGIDTPETLRGTKAWNAPEVDHIVPLSAGPCGPGHVWSNLQCLCRRCNSLKGSSLPELTSS